MNFKINIEPEGNTVEAVPGDTLKSVLESGGYYFPQNCGGKGKCGFCRVNYIEDAPKASTLEVKLFGESSDYRLACMHKVESDCTIYVPPLYEAMISGKTIAGFKVSGGRSGFGIACDLGTTTVALYLVNLGSGEIAGQYVFLNPQLSYGADVMTRLNLAKAEDKRKELTNAIYLGLTEGIKKLLNSGEVSPDQIVKLLIVGNTAMTHLFLGFGGEGLERAPFRSPFERRGCIPFNPEKIGLTWEVGCEILPILFSFIGGDTIASIIASDLDTKPGLRLMIDFGTNGEIVLSKQGTIWGCSAAAGPAFEGVGMYSGMPAVKGAVEAFTDEGEPKIIGGGKEPRGICGSGYISGIAYLLKNREITPAGLLKRDKNKKREWIPLLTGDNPPRITQDDIRKFQLAKGAISAGIEILCGEADVEYAHLDEIVITGSFGNRIDISAAVETGLIPRINPDKITFIDNAAGRGAALCLSDDHHRKRALKLRQKMNFINLGEHKLFQEVFVDKMKFPTKY
ncbi:MAG: DUF4445 domain-containing protein [candidate division Zixibacteria bacterium]|nr:DUF4445 domain-containing protein [Candidatus Tariuqbacter arcticus]